MLTTVRWPAGHEPDGAAIHAVNTGISTAPPEVVWGWLIRPDRWSEYYSNARKMRHQDGAWPAIELGSVFDWVTFGTRVKTVVTEFEPHRRLAWTGSGLGAIGHHAWVLDATESGGTRILTEETQRGKLISLVRRFHEPRMLEAHQLWVDSLANIAESSRTP